MESNFFTQFLAYALLWSIPVIKGVKFLFDLKSPPQTPTGRVLNLHDETTRLDEKVRIERVYLSHDVKIPRAKILELPNLDIGLVWGSLRAQKKPFIIISPKIDEISNPLFFWIYKRLTFFLNLEAYIATEALKILASFFTVFLFAPLSKYSFFGAFFLILVFSKTIGVIAKFLLDKAADTFASARSTLEELKDARSLLKAQIALLSKAQSPYSIHYYYQKKILEHRIEKIEKAIGSEHLGEKDDKVELLEKFLLDNYAKEQEFIEAKKMKILKWIDADED